VSDGPLCREFEKQLADYCGYKYCSVVSSGTVALMYAFKAIGCEYACMPSYTWISTPGAAKWAGAIPVFCDVDDDTWTLEKSMYRTECAVWPFGIKPRKELEIQVGDCAQALGSDITGCDIACLSFSYSKVLTTGEGGACLTNDLDTWMDIKELRDNGKLDEWEGTIDCKTPGFTGRMTEIQAAMGIVGMEGLEANLTRRAYIAARYIGELTRLNLDFCPMPRGAPNWGYFPIRVKSYNPIQPSRNNLWNALREAGIDARKYFSPCHKMAAYDTGQSLPVTEKLAQEVMTLPIYAGMPDEDVNYVIQKVREVLNG
jgi:dTDP-4-amino-4,6-dideoxygalactose transaminase